MRIGIFVTAYIIRAVHLKRKCFTGKLQLLSAYYRSDVAGRQRMAKHKDRFE
jgi:hypothetical protein